MECGHEGIICRGYRWLDFRFIRKSFFLFFFPSGGLIGGTKRPVSVNVCSVEGNSAGIFVCKVFTWYFRNKGKINAYYFRGDKTAVLGAIKAQLLFSEGKYQLLTSRNKIPFLAIFYHLNFQLLHPNRSNNVSSHKYPFERS